MISSDKVVASSLALEPNRAAILRDVYRADALGLKQILVNENMLELAAAEIKKAELNTQVSPVIGFPIGQWFWPFKKASISNLSIAQNGPTVIMHSVGSWLDQSEAAKAEQAGITALPGDKWLMTSLTLIPLERFDEFANDVTNMGISSLILSNGVAASQIEPPNSDRIRAIADAASGRFNIVARLTTGAGEAAATTALDAGADAVCSDDFWHLSILAGDRG